MAGVKGMKHRRPRNEKEKDIYRLARIEQILEEAREGKIELSKSQQFAIDQEYAKLKPSLSSVDQNITDPRDQLDAEELTKRLLLLSPELLERLYEARRNAANQASGQNEPQERVVKH